MDFVTQVFNKKLFDAYDLSVGNADSESVNIQGSPLYACHLIWSGFSGTVTVATQASNDGSNWANVDNFSVTGASGNRMLNVEKAGYAYVRLSVTATGAAGNLTAYINAKAI